MNFLSHYSVLVLSDEDTEVDGLLAPFNENISVKPYIKYTKEKGMLIELMGKPIKYCPECGEKLE